MDRSLLGSPFAMKTGLGFIYCILLPQISRDYVLSTPDETKFKDFIKDYLTKTEEISSPNKVTEYVPSDESIDNLYRQCLKCHVVNVLIVKN